MVKTPVIVQSHRPWRWVVYGGAGLVVAVVAGWLAYQRGQVNAVGTLAGLQIENAMLSQTLEQVMQQNTGLRERIALLERAAQVEQQAYREVDQTLTSLQAERLALKEELAFYRGIVSDNQAKDLTIRGLEIIPQPSGDYHYRLVLTQNMKNGKVIKGKVDIVVTGVLNSEPTSLGLDDLTEDGELELSIMHFQRFEGNLVLPEGLIPDTVRVVVKPQDGRGKKVEKSYPWPDSTAE